MATTPTVLVGTALQGVSYGTFLPMLTRADLSVVVPSGAGSYILIPLQAGIREPA